MLALSVIQNGVHIIDVPPPHRCTSSGLSANRRLTRSVVSPAFRTLIRTPIVTHVLQQTALCATASTIPAPAFEAQSSFQPDDEYEDLRLPLECQQVSLIMNEYTALCTHNCTHCLLGPVWLALHATNLHFPDHPTFSGW